MKQTTKQKQKNTVAKEGIKITQQLQKNKQPQTKTHTFLKVI